MQALLAEPTSQTKDAVTSDEFVRKTEDGSDYTGMYMYKIGKKHTGAMFNGKEYKEFPK